MRKRKKRKPAPAIFPLRALLAKYGVSQRKLARATGISEDRVSDLANGKHAPLWPTILRVCTALGADLGDLAPAPPAKKNAAAAG